MTDPTSTATETSAAAAPQRNRFALPALILALSSIALTVGSGLVIAVIIAGAGAGLSLETIQAIAIGFTILSIAIAIAVLVALVLGIMGIVKARKIKHRLGMSITATVLTVIFAGFSYVGPIVALIAAPTQSEIVASTTQEADQDTVAYSNQNIEQFIADWMAGEKRVAFTDNTVTADVDGAVIAEISREGSDLTDQALIDLGAEPATA